MLIFKPAQTPIEKWIAIGTRLIIEPIIITLDVGLVTTVSILVTSIGFVTIPAVGTFHVVTVGLAIGGMIQFSAIIIVMIRCYMAYRNDKLRILEI